MADKDDDLKYLYPADSVSSAAKQINEDDDLYGILVDIYRQGDTAHAKTRLEGTASNRKGRIGSIRVKGRGVPGFTDFLGKGPSQDRRNLIRNSLSSDKTVRREFAVQARKFLSERKAGDVVEAKRLRGGGKGKSRTAALLRASQGVTALGRTGLGASTSRVASMLGQAGGLG